MLRKKHIKSFILIVAIIAVSAIVIPISAMAGAQFANSKDIGFGGKVTSPKVSCSCSGSAGYQVSVSGPGQSSGTYLELPTTRLFRYSFISVGRNLLGLYTPGGQCWVAGSPCTQLPISKGTITGVGLSF